MELSKRLQAVIHLAPACDTLCDVGCDHGYVAITLLKRGIAKRVIAMDVNAGPLEQAKRNGAAYGVTEHLDFRLSDGLKEVQPGEAECFLCAGMGGRLMVRIMQEGTHVMCKMKGAVLQPQSELSLVRRYIYELGWHIVKEDMVFEPDGTEPDEGKYYPMMYIEPGEASMPSEAELLYGPLLIQEKHPVLWQYLAFSLRLKEELLAKLDGNTGAGIQAEGSEPAYSKKMVRIQELKAEMAVIRELM